MKLDVLFLIEHEDREGESVLRLAQYLRHEYEISSAIVSIGFSIHQITFLRPKLVVMPYFLNESVGVEKVLYDVYGYRVPVLNMNWEQHLSEANWRYKRPDTKFTQEGLFHLAWSDHFRNLLVNSGVDKENVFVTGNISNLLLREWCSKRNEIRSELASVFNIPERKEWVFLPMNYGWAFLTDHSIEAKIGQGYDRNIAWEYRDYSRRCLEKFVFFVEQLSKSNRIQIIIRPHPSVGVEQYKAIFNEINGGLPNNVVLSKDYSIREWIAASDIVGSSWSTSVWDARNIGKRCFLFTPYARPEWLDVWWNHEVSNITSVEEVLTLQGKECWSNESPILETSKVISQLLARSQKNVGCSFVKWFSFGKCFIKSFVKHFLMRFCFGWFVPEGAKRDFFKSEFIK